MVKTLTSSLKGWGELLSQGLVIILAPEIAKGMIIEIFKAEKVTVKSASDWVESNTNLWKTLNPDEQGMFKDLAERLGTIDWLDADWVIATIKADFPAVASLFLGWRKAGNWLKRQVEIIKKEIEGEASQKKGRIPKLKSEPTKRGYSKP